MIAVKATLKEAHSTLTVWYSYIVATSIVAQEEWDRMDDYIPKKWRHIALIIITLVVFADKIRRSAQRIEDI